MDKVIAVVLIGVALTACASIPKGQFCDVANPYFFTDAAEVGATPAPVKRFIVNHNETGAALCKWKPSK